MSTELKIAVLESIRKDEFRIPLHPNHFSLIHKQNNQLFFQYDYAKNFSQNDSAIKAFGFSTASRKELLEMADVIFLLKPTVDDLKKMKPGTILVGWCHAVQQLNIAKVAQERSLTLIAMESMYSPNNQEHEHLFYRNNYLAGSLGVEHALNSVPFQYERNAKISIISYGAVSQGAAAKLIEKGFTDITVFSRRNANEINNKLKEARYQTVTSRKNRFLIPSGEELKETLLASDIIVNGIMQDVLHPYYFLFQKDLKNTHNKLIIDLSCDDHMGFDFACSTSIDNPIINIEDNFYYAVDHVPTLAWKEISVDISEKLLPILNGFLIGKFDNALYETLINATEIQDGKIRNKTIAQYQNKVNSEVAV